MPTATAGKQSLPLYSAGMVYKLKAEEKGALVSKLFKLKEWLTIDDAARHMSAVCEEAINEADVLRLALDGHLKLSIFLVNGAYARPCVPVKIEEIEWDEIPSLNGEKPFQFAKNGRIFQDERGTIQVLRAITDLESAVWDLPMIGGEQIDVEFRYQQLIGGPKVTAVTLDGVFVAAKNGDLFELQSHLKDNKHYASEIKSPFLHPDNFHPAGSLPEDIVFVVRTSALTDFEILFRNYDGEDDANNKLEKPLTTRERNTYLKIIKALCDGQGLDLNQPYKAAEIIKNQLELLGSPLSLETIAGKLEQAKKS